MKKKIFSLLSTILVTGLVSACSKDNSTIFNIICPTGAPAIAFYTHSTKESFETNNDPNNIVAMMTSSSEKNVVAIDTTSGISAIKNGAPYKIAATITFGNFYLCSTGNDVNDSLDKNDKIILFKKNGLPDVIFHYLFENFDESNIQYVASAQIAAQCLTKGMDLDNKPVDYVFLAEPAVTSVLNNQKAPTYGKAKIYSNIQDEFYKKTNKTMIQASIFIKNNVNKNDGLNFLSNLEKDIDLALKEPELVQKFIDLEPRENYFGMTGQVAKNSLLNNNKIGLGFKKTSDIIDDINLFLSLFGIGNINEENCF